jgi:hypothetical protein
MITTKPELDPDCFAVFEWLPKLVGGVVEEVNTFDYGDRICVRTKDGNVLEVHLYPDHPFGYIIVDRGLTEKYDLALAENNT